MWINNSLHKPLRAGYYKCLVDTDGFGNLKEMRDQFFNGRDWCDYKSCKQHIVYWKPNYQKDLKIISDNLQKEIEEYLNK
jgi:hypothetical protein